MTSVDVMSFYKKFGNLFRIQINSRGTIYELGAEIDASVDKATTIHYNGKYYSFVAYSGSTETKTTKDILARFLSKRFELALKDKGYIFRKKYCVYKENKDEEKHPHVDIFRIFNGFEYRIVALENENDIFLCIDPHIILESVSSIADLIQRGISSSSLRDFSVRYMDNEGSRIDGYLVETDTEIEPVQKPNSSYFCRINRYRKKKEEPEEEIVPAERVFPESRLELIQQFLGRLGIDFDLAQFVRSLSFLDSPTPSLDRFVHTMKRVEELTSSGVFPLKFNGFSFELNKQPIVLRL